MVAFSVFSFCGPIISACLPEADPWKGYGYIGRQVFELEILTWPMILFSVGKPGPSTFSLIEANLILFAIIGLLVGFLADSVELLLMMYLIPCVLLSGLAAAFCRFHLVNLDWLALGAALLLYAIPFGVVLWYVKRSSST
jgi:hypothetical protein